MNFARRKQIPPSDPTRRDWSFSWERSGFRAKDAPYRLNVTLAGDRVSGYDEYLKVPEAWKLGYDRLRSSNNLFEYIALIPYAFLLGGCLYVIISLGRRGVARLAHRPRAGRFPHRAVFPHDHEPVAAGPRRLRYQQPYSSFFLSQVGEAALISVVSALLVVIAVVPGEPLYRMLAAR